MKRSFLAGASLAAAMALSGCVEVSVPAGGAAPPGNEPEAAARAACIRDVRAETGNPDVSVIRSSFSEAGTEVILQVGPTGTWRCIAYRDGTTAGIMSMTDEGFL
jgi:hypothetical protein